MPEVIRLIVMNNALYFPRGGTNYDAIPVKYDCPETPSILIRSYDTGDCDVTAWPIKAKRGVSREELLKRLARALFDERECNNLFPLTP